MPDRPIFTRTGDGRLDHWLVDGRHDFSVFPRGIVPDVSETTPIRLSVGDRSFGEVHITGKHEGLLKKNNMSTPELVYLKLADPGAVHCCEEKKKLKINLAIHPSALLILTLVERIGEIPFFSVTTMYQKNRRVDGMRYGRYPGRLSAYKNG
jgi:hypothetical protein